MRLEQILQKNKIKKIFFVPLLAFSIYGASISSAHEGHKMEHNHPYPKANFNMKNGEGLYNKYCASCHGVKGDGNGPAALALNPKPTDFLDKAYGVMRSRVDYYESIMNGRPDTTMPPWKGTLSERDVWDIIDYIEHLFNHQMQHLNKH